MNAQNWSSTFYNAFTISSPRGADLNGDGIKDIVMGGAKDDGIGGQAITNGYLAVDGATGATLWTVPAANQIFGSALLGDISGDGIPEIIMGGRRPEFKCINGASGTTIWDFATVNTGGELEDPDWWNFYNPQWIPDMDDNGINEILVANGGNHAAPPWDSLNRPIGRLVIINATTGEVMHYAQVPDGRETYMSPLVHDFFGQGRLEIIFGTGGETFHGSLWRANLGDVIAGDLSNALELTTNSRNVGFVGPPSLADINNDNVADIIVNSYEGKVKAINGVTNELMWEVIISSEDIENTSTPAIGFFTDDNIPDVFSLLFEGIAPAYTVYRQVLIDGSNGEIIWQDSIGFFYYNSPLAYDTDNDGKDEVIMSIDNRFGEFPNVTYSNEVILLDFGQIEPGPVNPNITTLFGPVNALNINATPLITDLDNDGLLDLLQVHSLIDPFANGGLDAGSILNRIETQIPAIAPVLWGSYMGSNYDGYFPNPHSNCTQEYELTLETTNLDCWGGNSGLAMVTSSGCPNPLECDYLWSNAQNSQTATDLSAGTYYVTITHPDGCVRVAQAELTQPAAPTYFLETTPPLCQYSEDGLISINGLEPNVQYGIQWSNEVESPINENLGVGDYSVDIYEPGTGCTYTLHTVLESTSQLVLNAIIEETDCQGTANGSIHLQLDDPEEYLLSWTGDTVINDAFILDHLPAGVYELALEDTHGCIYHHTYTLGEPDALIMESSTTPACFDENDGSIMLQYSGGTAPYTPQINGQNYPSSFSTIFVKTALAPGDYQVSLTDAQGCEVTASLSIPAISIDIHVSDATAISSADGSLYVETVNETEPVFIILNDSLALAQGEIADGLSPGTYHLTITHGTECSQDTLVEIGFISGQALDKPQEDFYFYPNPAQELIFLKLFVEMPATWSLISYDGRQIAGGNLSSGDYHTLYLPAQISEGLYFIEIIQGKSVFYNKLEITE